MSNILNEPEIPFFIVMKPSYNTNPNDSSSSQVLTPVMSCDENIQQQGESILVREYQRENSIITFENYDVPQLEQETGSGITANVSY